MGLYVGNIKLQDWLNAQKNNEFKPNEKAPNEIVTKIKTDSKAVIKKYLDYADSSTKKFIDSFNEKDIDFLANKIIKIYQMMPKMYYHIFEKGKIDTSKPATINEFTVKGGILAMHCVFNTNTKLYDCNIDKA